MVSAVRTPQTPNRGEGIAGKDTPEFLNASDCCAIVTAVLCGQMIVCSEMIEALAGSVPARAIAGHERVRSASFPGGQSLRTKPALGFLHRNPEHSANAMNMQLATDDLAVELGAANLVGLEEFVDRESAPREWGGPPRWSRRSYRVLACWGKASEIDLGFWILGALRELPRRGARSF